MKKSDELKQKLAALEADNKTLVEKESRSVEENAKVDEYIAQREQLEKEIEREEKIEKLRSIKIVGSGKVVGGAKEKGFENYSFRKAIFEKAFRGGLTGLEKEMHEEALRVNPDIQGIGVPEMVISSRAALAASSSPVVATETKDFIDALRAKLVVNTAGANVMTGLKGNITIPKKTTAASATWEGETDASADAGMALGSISLSPKRLSAYQTLSKQLLVQSSYDVEQLLRNDLVQAVAIAVDAAAIEGGAANTPTGILNTVGIGSVAGGTNGAAPDWADIVNLEKEVAVDDADVGALAFLTNPKVRAKLKQTAVGTDQRMVWPANGADLMGYNTYVTTQVPSDLDKGTSTGVCSAIIFGNFNDLMIGQWGGLDIVIDPYTAASNAQVKTYIHSFWDVAVRHAQSFAAMKDALTT